MNLDSKTIIGRVKERYNEIFRPDRRWNVWRGFYNGWLEGRMDMLIQIKKDIPDPSLFKKRRLLLNMSMQDVSDKTDVSKATISRIEKGNDAFFRTINKLHEFYTKMGV